MSNSQKILVKDFTDEMSFRCPVWMSKELFEKLNSPLKNDLKQQAIGSNGMSSKVISITKIFAILTKDGITFIESPERGVYFQDYNSCSK